MWKSVSHYMLKWVLSDYIHDGRWLIIAYCLHMLSTQQTEMKFYRESTIHSQLCLCCWCPRLCSVVSCFSSQDKATADVTRYSACRDFSSVPVPKISPPRVSWISHDPKRLALNFGPRLSCVHTLLLFLPMTEPKLPSPPLLPIPNLPWNVILPLSSLSSSVRIYSWAWASSCQIYPPIL